MVQVRNYPEIHPPFGGLGLPIEVRENRSACKEDWIITTTGYDLVHVIEVERWNYTVCRFDGVPFTINLRYTGNRVIYKRIALANLYGHVCMACGATDKLTMDHVIPRADNGTSSLTNLQLLCKECNVAKADSFTDYRFMTPAEIFWLCAEEWETGKLTTKMYPWDDGKWSQYEIYRK